MFLNKIMFGIILVCRLLNYHNTSGRTQSAVITLICHTGRGQMLENQDVHNSKGDIWALCMSDSSGSKLSNLLHEYMSRLSPGEMESGRTVQAEALWEGTVHNRRFTVNMLLTSAVWPCRTRENLSGILTILSTTITAHGFITYSLRAAPVAECNTSARVTVSRSLRCFFSSVLEWCTSIWKRQAIFSERCQMDVEMTHEAIMAEDAKRMIVISNLWNKKEQRTAGDSARGGGLRRRLDAKGWNLIRRTESKHKVRHTHIDILFGDRSQLWRL